MQAERRADGLAGCRTIVARVSTKAKILAVVGTRPEAIKMVPVIVALRDHDVFEPVVISTGQHHQMVAEVLGLAGIEPETDLWAHGRAGRLNELVTSVMRRFEDFCDGEFKIGAGELPEWEVVRTGESPAAVLVHGDTTHRRWRRRWRRSTCRIPVVHVEAGLRTGDALARSPRR